MSEPRCGFQVTRDGYPDACDSPATGWRWYQDCEHEDTLEPACVVHENEGGRRMYEAEANALLFWAALRDFADHGTRHDLTPTMPGGDTYMHMMAYIRRMDSYVRETARRALQAAK